MYSGSRRETSNKKSLILRVLFVSRPRIGFRLTELFSNYFSSLDRPVVHRLANNASVNSFLSHKRNDPFVSAFLRENISLQIPCSRRISSFQCFSDASVAPPDHFIPLTSIIHARSTYSSIVKLISHSAVRQAENSKEKSYDYYGTNRRGLLLLERSVHNENWQENS